MSSLNYEALDSLGAAFYVIRYVFNMIVSLMSDNFILLIYTTIAFAALMSIVPLASYALHSGTRHRNFEPPNITKNYTYNTEHFHVHKGGVKK